MMNFVTFHVMYFIDSHQIERDICLFLSQLPLTSSNTQLGKACFSNVYEGFLINIRFCTRHKSLSTHLCGPSSRRRRKSNGFQCFQGFSLNPKVVHWMRSGDCVPRTKDRSQQTMLLPTFLKVSW